MTDTTTVPTSDDSYDDTEPDLDTLEYQGRRHLEALDGPRKTQAYYTAQVELHEAAVTELTAALASATTTDRGGAHERLDIRRSLGEHQFYADVHRFELAELAPQIAETLRLIEANKAAVAKATPAAEVEQDQ